jgi:hypothetical protein
MENNVSLQPTGINSNQKTGKSRRGFASMDKEKHKLVSSKGGQSPRSKLEDNNTRRPQGYTGF